MRSEKHAILFVNILTIFHYAVCCTYDRNNERATCHSFEDLTEAGDHYEWTKLNVINPGSEPFLPIRKGLFKGFPNVKDLQVKGLANEIQHNTWEGLDNLYELHLDDNKFHVIQTGAFSNLPCTAIFIYNCEVQKIMPKSFNNLPRLRQVYIYGNNISTIKEGVFSDTGIATLVMRKNRIRNVESNAFNNMDNLIQLSLEENELTSFSPQLTIGYAGKLTHLYINRNKITEVSRDMFSVMPNLKVLLLNINQIESLGDNVFTDLRKLILVDISHNRLEELQSNIFNHRGHPQLNFFFIHDNRLSFLSSGVLVRLPNLRKFSVGGNPWQCPCWETLDSYIVNHNITKLCDDAYKAGERPTCVYSEKASTDCIYDLENVRNLPKLYEEQVKDYAKLPPVCNVENVEKSFLGAK